MFLPFYQATFDMGLTEGVAHNEYLILVLLIMGQQYDMPKLICSWTTLVEGFFLDQGRTSPVLIQAKLPMLVTLGLEEPGRQS